MACPNTNNSTTSEEVASNATLFTNVAPTWSTTHTEGGYDYELMGGTDSRYECPICLLCLRDPVLTTCGHRFCSSCISQWVVKENGKCPVDSVSLSHENIFPDNYTRREIMQCMAKCPFSKDKVSCPAILPIVELENHIQKEHASVTNNPLSGSGHNGMGFSNGNCLLECPYKEVGCAIPLRQEQRQRHLDMNVQHHLQLLTAAYKRLKIFSSRTNLEFPGSSSSADYFLRQDSRDSTRWLLDESLSPDDYQFRRQRSWDSVRFARKHNIRPSNLATSSSWLPESEESLCQASSHGNLPPSPPPKPDKSGKEAVNGNANNGTRGLDPRMQDIFQRLVLLEQKDREKQIKIEKLEAELNSVVSLFSTSTQIINDFTARYCHGVYVWKIPNFRNLCLNMRRNPNKVLNSPGFYTDTFGYKMCLRFNLTTPSSSSEICAGVPVDVPLEDDEDTFISLYVHFMQGEFDDTLHWPFNGKMKLIVIHPKIPEDSIAELMTSKPEAAAFAKPPLLRNPKGFGYPEFCPINKIFANGFVNDDTLVCKVLAYAIDIFKEMPL